MLLGIVLIHGTVHFSHIKRYIVYCMTMNPETACERSNRLIKRINQIAQSLLVTFLIDTNNKKIKLKLMNILILS